MDYEAEFAKNFLTSCKKDGISIRYQELNNRDYKVNYDRVIREIRQSNPIEDNKNYRILKYDEIIYIAIILDILRN